MGSAEPSAMSNVRFETPRLAACGPLQTWVTKAVVPQILLTDPTSPPRRFSLLVGTRLAGEVGERDQH